MCYGRLDFSALLHHTGLTPKQLKHSLVVLIQQHLAFWDVSAESDSSYYEANWRSAYDLARSGKLIKVVEDRYGQSVGGLVSNLLLSGHVSVSDLAQAYDLTPPEGKPDSSKLAKNGSTNGVLNGQPRYPVGSSTASVDHFYESLIILLNDDFVSIVNESHFRSEADNRLRAQSIIGKQERFQGQLKAAEKECYEHAVQQQLVDWKYSSNLSDKSIEMRASQILKRTKKRHAENELNGDERPEKRRRLSPDFDSANGLSTHVERDLNVHLEVCHISESYTVRAVLTLQRAVWSSGSTTRSFRSWFVTRSLSSTCNGISALLLHEFMQNCFFTSKDISNVAARLHRQWPTMKVVMSSKKIRQFLLPM